MRAPRRFLQLAPSVVGVARSIFGVEMLDLLQNAQKAKKFNEDAETTLRRILREECRRSDELKVQLAAAAAENNRLKGERDYLIRQVKSARKQRESFRQKLMRSGGSQGDCRVKLKEARKQIERLRGAR